MKNKSPNPVGTTGRSCTINGVTYSKVSIALREFGLVSSTVYNTRNRCKLPIEEVIEKIVNHGYSYFSAKNFSHKQGINHQPITCNGFEYTSINSFCVSNGIVQRTFQQYKSREHRKGMSISEVAEEFLESRKPKPIKIPKLTPLNMAWVNV